MKAGFCSRMWRPASGVMLIGALAFAVSAQGGPRVADGTARDRTKSDTARQVTGAGDHIRSVVAGGGATMVFELIPVASWANGSYGHAGAYSAANISGNTLTVNAGGFRSFWNVMYSDWDTDWVGPNANTALDTELRNMQGQLDVMTLMNGVGGDLTYANPGCGGSGDCATAYGEPGAGCAGGMCQHAWVNKNAARAPFFETAFNTDGDCAIPVWDKNVVDPLGPRWFGSHDPDRPADGVFCGQRDTHVSHYFGSLALDVPADAKGTYTLAWIDDINITFATETGDGPDPQYIPFGFLRSGVLVIPTGSCCFGIGGVAPGCADDLTLAECNALAQPSIFNAGEACVNPPSDEGCCACINNAQCNDNDACTNDTCNNCICTNAPIPAWNQGTQCCNAANGQITTPVDANVCSNAECSIAPNRGTAVQVPVPADEPCKGIGDDNPCSFNDVCDGAGAADSCSGSDVNSAMIPCDDNDDCLAATGLSGASCVENLCNCTLIPDLTVDIEPGDKDDPNCFASGNDGEKVIARVHVAATTSPINGGQFLITYDPTCLQYNSAVGVAPYTSQVFGPVVDQAAGTIFTVVGVGFGVGNGPAGNADMVELSFTKIGDCNSCQICFASNNPQNTRLVDAAGQGVDVNALCSKEIVANNVVTIDGPEKYIKTNVDCGNQPTASVTWDSPTVSDSCGEATMVCTGVNQSGQVLDHLVMNGGSFPIGVNNFCCNATSDWCDKTAEQCWTVEVNDQVGLDIEIALSPGQQGKPGADLTRCIKFTLYKDTIQEPFRFEENITFGGFSEYVGKSKDALKIPRAGQYQCISAWDQLHTLRSCYLFDSSDCVDGRWHASFRGDPAWGGNWLIGGNLDGWKKNLSGGPDPTRDFVIDVSDWGTFASQWGANYGTGDTPCGTPGPHADINGDGLVDLADYSYIHMNFLTTAKECCEIMGLPANIVGRTEISVKELREQGLSELAAGDLNGDGVLNLEDMQLFMQGVRPEGKATRGVRKGSGTR